SKVIVYQGLRRPFWRLRARLQSDPSRGWPLWPVFLFGRQQVLRMMDVIHPRLASVEVRWWNPLGAAVFPPPGGPAAGFDDAVVGSAGQGEFVGVGVTAARPIVDV